MTDQKTYIVVMPIRDLVQFVLPHFHHASAFPLDALLNATFVGSIFRWKCFVAFSTGISGRAATYKRRRTSPGSHRAKARIGKRVRRVGFVDLHRYWTVF